MLRRIDMLALKAQMGYLLSIINMPLGTEIQSALSSEVQAGIVMVIASGLQHEAVTLMGISYGILIQATDLTLAKSHL